MTQELRSRDAIKAQFEDLTATDRPETPQDDRGVYNLNQDGLQYDGKIAALKWLLEEPRSEIDVYRKFREKRDSGVTCERNGAEQTCRLDGWVSMLRWALQAETPEHPDGVYDRVDDTSTALFNLIERVHPDAELNEDDFPLNNDEVDIEKLHTQLRAAYRAVSDARIHMLNGPDEDRETVYGCREDEESE